MCFSAEASFSAAIVLGVAGAYTLKICSLKSLRYLAAVPLLFALQQFSEGILWLNLTHRIDPPFLFTVSGNVFLIFAFLIWPMWIPYALFMAEKNPLIKKMIGVDLLFGIALSSINLFYAVQQHISIEVVNHSLQYFAKVPNQTYIYPLIILLPCFVSTLKSVKSFALLIAVAYVAASYFYAETFVSVWCFFSAVVSLVIYKVIKEEMADKKSSSIDFN